MREKENFENELEMYLSEGFDYETPSSPLTSDDKKFISDIFDYLLGIQPIESRIDFIIAEFAADLLYKVWDKVYFINMLSNLPEPKNEKNPGVEYIQRKEVQAYWKSHYKDIDFKKRKAISDIVNAYILKYDGKFLRKGYTFNQIPTDFPFKILKYFFP